MTARQLLAEVQALGCRLSMRDKRLQVDAPKGAMSEDLIRRLNDHKPEILAALAEPGPAAYPPLSPAAEARRHPFEVLAILEEREREPEVLWWRVAILEPGGRKVEVDTPSGWTLADWQAYAERYHGPGCAVTAIAGLPNPRAPANLVRPWRAPARGWRASLRRSSGRCCPLRTSRT